MTLARNTFLILGLAAALAACDSMNTSSQSGPEILDDEQNFGTEPSDPNA